MAAGQVHVLADDEVCVGAGRCVLTAPEVFDQDDALGTVVLRDARPPAALTPAVRDAVRLCPSGALSLADDARDQR